MSPLIRELASLSTMTPKKRPTTKPSAYNWLLVPTTKYPEKLEALTNELRRWIVSNQFNQISLREGVDPAGDLQDNYKLIYIGKIVPESVRAATLEVHVSETGGIGLGFDTREGIARRLAVKNRRQGFRDGFES